jgi:hypothetical protein
MVDALPAGLTAISIAGSGWSCTLANLVCTRGDPLAAAASYPPIILTVNVATGASGSVSNVATVSGGGETNTGNDTTNDPTTITSTNAAISGSVNNLNLWNYLVANGYAASGRAGTWVVTINSGVVIGSGASSVYALDTGVFPTGSVLTITNNGIIVGAGGAGGTGGNCFPTASAHPGQSGLSGGTALGARLPLRLVNSGSIWGGGGGGGGGGCTTRKPNGKPIFSFGGGGGGGGAASGPGGAGGVEPSGSINGPPGSSGGVSSGGAGGVPSSAVTAPNNGTGGAGGGPAQAGASGLAGLSGSGGAGGAAGPAVVGNSNVTWVSTGDVRGTLN